MNYLEPARVTPTAELHSIAPALQKNLTREIIVFLPDCAQSSDAQMVREVFSAANDLIPGAPYQLSVRSLSAPVDNDPRKWRRRSCIFPGDLQTRWLVDETQRKRLQQILHLSPRTTLIGGAVFLLAASGLGNHHKLAIHRNFLAAATEENLQELSPGVQHVKSGTISSAVSSFAALPIFLEMIQQDQGHFIADALTEYLGLSQSHSNPSKVFLNLQRLACDDTLIVTTLKAMQDNIENPLRIRELAGIVGVSTRQLERRFQEKTGASPLPAYRALRLEQALQLLQHTSLSLAEIALATGFGTRCNLTRWFTKEYNSSPKNLRKEAFSGETTQGYA